eukprot:Rhum_TRINITY_DN25785_c0_g1::Rhum_TRINITY_DN25785_c0_g1_i1::g.182771::m.182771
MQRIIIIKMEDKINTTESSVTRRCGCLVAPRLDPSHHIRDHLLLHLGKLIEQLVVATLVLLQLLVLDGGLLHEPPGPIRVHNLVVRPRHNKHRRLEALCYACPHLLQRHGQLVRRVGRDGRARVQLVRVVALLLVLVARDELAVDLRHAERGPRAVQHLHRRDEEAVGLVDHLHERRRQHRAGDRAVEAGVVDEELARDQPAHAVPKDEGRHSQRLRRRALPHERFAQRRHAGGCVAASSVALGGRVDHLAHQLRQVIGKVRELPQVAAALHVVRLAVRAVVERVRRVAEGGEAAADLLVAAAVLHVAVHDEQDAFGLTALGDP